MSDSGEKEKHQATAQTKQGVFFLSRPEVSTCESMVGKAEYKPREEREEVTRMHHTRDDRRDLRLFLRAVWVWGTVVDSVGLVDWRGIGRVLGRPERLPSRDIN